MSVSALDNAPEYIRFGVLQLSKDGWTSKQLVEWLEGHGIHLPTDSVNYHLRKNGIYTDRKWWVDPADTPEKRKQQYVTALISYKHQMFRLWDINLKGGAWGFCTRALLNDGIIEKIQGRRRWYRILVSKETLVAMIESSREDASDAVSRAAGECII